MSQSAQSPKDDEFVLPSVPILGEKKKRNKKIKPPSVSQSLIIPLYDDPTISVDEATENAIDDDDRKPSGDDPLINTGMFEASALFENCIQQVPEPYEEPNDEICIICQEPLGDAKTIGGENCQHLFHCGECWEGVITRKNECPLCKAILQNEGWTQTHHQYNVEIYQPIPVPVPTAEEIELAEFEAEEAARAERRRQLQARVGMSRMMGEATAIRQRKILALNLRKQQEAERRRLQDLAFSQEEEDIMAMTNEEVVQEEIASRAVIAAREVPVQPRARNPSVPRARQPRVIEEPSLFQMVAATPTETGLRRRGGNGNRTVRTPMTMDIQVGDILVMTLNGVCWRVDCVNAFGVGVFSILEAPGREDLQGQQFNSGSPINTIFQELVVSVGLRRQSRAPFSYTFKIRNGVNLGRLT